MSLKHDTTGPNGDAYGAAFPETRVHESALCFPGGSVAIPQPTRADLVLSAQQWSTRAREELLDSGYLDAGYHATAKRVMASFDRLDAVLKELGELQ